MTGNNKEFDVIFFGPLSITAKLFYHDTNSLAGEVVLNGSCQYNGRRLTNIVHDVRLLQLHIVQEKFQDGGFVAIECDDTFFPHLPYMKRVQSFREFLISQLKKHFGESKDPIDALFVPGVNQYVSHLATFDDTHGLVRQAKSAVNRLDAKRHNAKKLARGVLLALGENPDSERTWEWRQRL